VSRGMRTRSATANELWAEFGGPDARFETAYAKKSGRPYLRLVTASEYQFCATRKTGACLGLALADEMGEMLALERALGKQQASLASCVTMGEADYVRGEMRHLSSEYEKHQRKAQALRMAIEKL